jgi:hypothetical protein
MIEALRMLTPQICTDIHSAISLLASADGAGRWSWLAFPVPQAVGRAPAHASHFPTLDQKRDSPTNDTCSPHGCGSSESADLSESLANKLKRRLERVGSILYSSHWKKKATPAGRQYWAHIASAAPIDAKGSTGSPTGWGTVTTFDNYKSKVGTSRSEGQENWRLGNQARLAGWGTPVTSDKGSGDGTDTKGRLGNQARMAGWGTPNTMDHLPSSNLEERQKKGGCSNLKDQVTLIGTWATPTTRDWKDTGDLSLSQVRKDGRQRDDTLARQASTLDSGTVASGSPAKTAKPAQLNPAHSRWLMGFPSEWDACVPSEMPLCRKRRRSS